MHCPTTGSSHRSASFRIVQQIGEAVDQGRARIGLYQYAAPGPFDEFRERAVLRQHHRHAAGQCLEHRQPLGFVVGRGHAEHVERTEQLQFPVSVDLAEPVDARAEASRCDLLRLLVVIDLIARSQIARDSQAYVGVLER